MVKEGRFFAQIGASGGGGGTDLDGLYGGSGTIPTGVIAISTDTLKFTNAQIEIRGADETTEICFQVSDGALEPASTLACNNLNQVVINGTSPASDSCLDLQNQNGRNGFLILSRVEETPITATIGAMVFTTSELDSGFKGYDGDEWVSFGGGGGGDGIYGASGTIAEDCIATTSGSFTLQCGEDGSLSFVGSGEDNETNVLVCSNGAGNETFRIGNGGDVKINGGESDNTTFILEVVSPDMDKGLGIPITDGLPEEMNNGGICMDDNSGQFLRFFNECWSQDQVNNKIVLEIQEGGEVNWDVTCGNLAILEMTEACTLMIDVVSMPPSWNGRLFVYSDASGPYALTLGEGEMMVGGDGQGVVTLSSTAQQIDTIDFFTGIETDIMYVKPPLANYTMDYTNAL